ncbi:MAG TPA: DUF962 domain-containing protein [Terriglobales bacterium]|nr:DUF962 domain-containing protein [Terriglobales bacterium]
MQDRQFSSYNEFFAFYLEQHAKAGNRFMHACGTALGLAVFAFALVTGHYLWALLWIPVAYGFAWTGHFLIEGNKPATFGHPWWSFISDFRMLGLMLSGRLESKT